MLACAPADADDTGSGADAGSDATDADALPGPPALSGRCSGPPADPRRLVVTTTDFATGALALVDLPGGEVRPDLALGSTDAKAFYNPHDGRVYVIHRYMIDALDVLDPADLALLGQTAVTADGAPSANPHALAFAPDQRGYLTLFGAPELQVLDLADAAAVRVADRIDLGPLADADGNPEASLALRCGETLFVSVQRLDRDRGFAPTGAVDHLAPIDLASGRLHDLDPGAPGVQPLPLLGPFARQWRLDPADPDGRTALILTTGVERVDLAALTVAWAVTPERLGVVDRFQPQAFDLDDAGARAYVARYTADLLTIELLRVDLDADDPPLLLATGLAASEQTLEVVGDTLWFGDRTHGAPGLRAWDLDVDPPAPRWDGAARPTGLAPYQLLAIP